MLINNKMDKNLSKVEAEFNSDLEDMIFELESLSDEEITGVYMDLMRSDNVS